MKRIALAVGRDKLENGADFFLGMRVRKRLHFVGVTRAKITRTACSTPMISTRALRDQSYPPKHQNLMFQFETVNIFTLELDKVQPSSQDNRRKLSSQLEKRTRSAVPTHASLYFRFTFH